MMTRMEKMHVETSEIQMINTINVPSIVTCISKCRTVNVTAVAPPAGDPPETSPPRCNTIHYDEDSSICELSFITGATKWDSRSNVPSNTRKDIFARVAYNYSSPGSPSP